MKEESQTAQKQSYCPHQVHTDLHAPIYTDITHTHTSKSCTRVEETQGDG